ncbi:ABI family, member 3a isoform X2 [Oryzias latipes]
MKNQNLDLEVAKILEDAPGSRKALRENYDNLLNVADYCCSNYTQTGEGGLKALEETKQFTTQSLASVAYQISTLASSVMRLLDAQTHQLRGLESSINLIGQTVEMHKEKVARREIGILTTVRRVPRSHKIIPPTAPQLRPPYSRQPISYQELDELGHGMKISGKLPDKMGTIRKHGASIRFVCFAFCLLLLQSAPPFSCVVFFFRASKTPEPVQCPTAPPVGGSSFGKPVAPPTIPPAWQAPPECDIIEDLLNETLPPPPSADPEPAQDDGVTSMFTPPPPPPPPDALVGGMVPPPPPPPPPPQSFPGVPMNSTAPPPDPTSAPPTSLETVLEENSFPSPSPPPHSDDEILPPPPSDGLELPAPPPPPAAAPEVEVVLPSTRKRLCRFPPSCRSASLRVSSGPASRCRYARSLFLPADQSLMIPPPPPYPPPGAPQRLPSSSAQRCLPARLDHLDLEIPAPPLMQVEFDDFMPPLPPPVDYDAPPQYLDKVVALYSYEASKPDDLSLTEGDIIYLTHRHDDGWCQGVLNGKHGFFPDNYVQSCS